MTAPASPPSSAAPSGLVMFADALRAILQQPGLHLAVAWSYWSLFFLSYCCCSSALILGLGADVFRTPASTSAFVSFGIAVVGLAVQASLVALHRGVTVAAVQARLRAAPLRFGDAVRAGRDQWSRQLGVETIRILGENLLGAAAVVLLFVLGPGQEAVGLAGTESQDATFGDPAMWVAAFMAYAPVATFVRVLLGPTTATVGTAPGFVEGLRASASFGEGGRGAYLRLRLAFGALAILLLGGTITWVGYLAASLRYDSEAAIPTEGFAPLVVASLLFYGFLYLLFVLDVAVDAAFVAHTTKAGRDTDVARVFD